MLIWYGISMTVILHRAEEAGYGGKQRIPLYWDLVYLMIFCFVLEVKIVC